MHRFCVTRLKLSSGGTCVWQVPDGKDSGHMDRRGEPRHMRRTKPRLRCLRYCFFLPHTHIMTRANQLARGARALVTTQAPRYIARARFVRNVRQYSDYIPTGTTIRTAVNELTFASPSQTDHKLSDWVDVPASGAIIEVAPGVEATSTSVTLSSVLGAEGPQFSNIFLRDSCK